MTMAGTGPDGIGAVMPGALASDGAEALGGVDGVGTGVAIGAAVPVLEVAVLAVAVSAVAVSAVAMSAVAVSALVVAVVVEEALAVVVEAVAVVVGAVAVVAEAAAIVPISDSRKTSLPWDG